MGKGKKVTVGYWYGLGLHLIICRAPVDVLLEIIGGDRSAWKGSVTASQRITIDAPNLWGGEEREGGIQGEVDVMMGEKTQGPNDYLAAHQPGVRQPGYRNKLGLVFRGGWLSAMNPYIKPWAIRVRRIKNGWFNDACWHEAKAAIEIEAGRFGMNPAHMVYQVLTDPLDGMSYPAGLIGQSFTEAADTLHAEKFGLCAAWNRSGSIEGFIQEICDHAGAMVYRDTRTGLWEMKLLRNDYDAATLPEITGDMVIERVSAARALLSETVNELTCVYRDGETGKEGSVTVHHLANIQAQGAVVSQKMNYPMAATFELATRIVMRDLRVKAAELWRFKLRCNRKAVVLRQGHVYRYSDPELGIVGMPVRVVRINLGSQRNTDIQIDLVEDVFGMPATTYVADQGSGWVPPPKDATPPAAFAAYEASYRDMVRDGIAPEAIAAMTPMSGYVAGVAARPTGGYVRNWTLYTRSGSAPYTAKGNGDFAGTAVLSAPVTIGGAAINIENVNGMEDLAPGQALQIGGIERVRVVGIAGNVITIARGCEDTVPRAHPQGTRVWAVDEDAASDTTAWMASEVVAAKGVTNGTQGPLPLADAPGSAVTITGRAHLPYPPGKVRVAGVAAPETVSGSFTVTWAGRNRIVQADTLVDHEAGPLPPESTTRYALRVFDASDALLVEKTNIDGETATVQLNYTGAVTIELSAITDAGESWQRHERTFAYTGTAAAHTITAATYVAPTYILDGGGA